MLGTKSFRSRTPRPLLGAVLCLTATSVMACGPRPVQQWTRPTAAISTEEVPEVLIMPLGQKSKRVIRNWISEDQRLVLAYFDIFLRHGFQGATTSFVTVPDASFETDALEFSRQALAEADDPNWSMFVPLSGRVAHEGRYPDYVLLFDDLSFGIYGGGGARQTYDTVGGGRAEVRLEYILWDNEKEEIAAFGRLQESASTNSPHPSSILFKDMFERMVREIIQGSPLSSGNANG